MIKPTADLDCNANRTNQLPAKNFWGMPLTILFLLWVNVACFSVCFYQGLQWERTKKILALIPPERASSTDSSASDDEVIIEGISARRRRLSEDDDTDCSSEPRSIPSSLERMNILDSTSSEHEHDASLSAFDQEQEYQSRPNNVFTPFDEDSVPLTPIAIQYDQLPILNSVSSVLSPIVTPATIQKTRSKRKANLQPRLVVKRVKKYQRPPILFKWKRGKFEHTATLEEPSIISADTTSKSPLDYFFKFFSEEIIDYITEQTNLYSVQSNPVKCIDVTNTDMRDFLAVTILMGIIKLPSYRDYWNKDYRYPLIADVMPLKKYEQIRRFLHFVDNTEVTDDRYFKLRPLLEKVRTNCLQLEEECRYSIDEMMVAYKGTRAGNRRQYMPKKPKKWGIKLFVRAGVSGLVYDFLPYGGEDTFRFCSFTEYENSLGLGAKVVLALCKTIKKKPANVYFDNFFTSLELIHFLREEYGIFSLGTIRANRLKGCQEFLPSDKELSKKGRGSSKQIVCNEKKVAVVKWIDNKSVTLASSFVDSFPMGKVKRWSKESKSKVDVECPAIVRQYNSFMGGVDLSDMLVALYKTNFRTKRWYMAIFSQLLDVCINNAWLLHRRETKEKSGIALKKFRRDIAIELMKKNRLNYHHENPASPVVNRIVEPVAPRPSEAIRFDNVGHLPVYRERGRCRYCKEGQTSVHCVKCELRLCFLPKRNCFFNFHVK